MRNAKLGDYLFWKGKIAKVSAETDQRQIMIQVYESERCNCCQRPLEDQVWVIPTSPLFQDNAELIELIKKPL